MPATVRKGRGRPKSGLGAVIERELDEHGRAVITLPEGKTKGWGRATARKAADRLGVRITCKSEEGAVVAEVVRHWHVVAYPAPVEGKPTPAPVAIADRYDHVADADRVAAKLSERRPFDQVHVKPCSGSLVGKSGRPCQEGR